MTTRFRLPAWVWFAAAATVVTLWLYRAFIFDGSVMLWGREMIDQSWQLREFGVEEIKAGRGVPLWDPYVFGGVPYVAILPGPVFYPTTALYFMMPLFRAIGWTFVLHTWLAALFAYLAARSLHMERWAAVVSGFAFMLTGLMTSMNRAGHDGRMFVIALIPLAFTLLEYGLRSGRLAWFLGMGLVVACQIFSPHVQLMYYSSLALSLYMLVRVIWIAKDEGRAAGVRRFGYYALGFVAAAAIGVAQLLPTFQLMGIAVRGGGATGYEYAASWAMPPQELTAFVLPDLIGSLGTYWGANPFKQHTEYVGIVPAALAVIGLTLARRDRKVGLMAAITLLCVLFALGAATPVHRIAYVLVPMVSKFRGASMMIGPAAFFIAILAGYGWQRVLDARRDEAGLPWAWIIGLSAPALLLGLAAALAPEGLVRWVHTTWYPLGWPKRPGPEAIALLRASGWLLVGIWSSMWVFAYAVAERRLPRSVTVAVLVLLVLDLVRVDARYISVIAPAEAFAADSLVEQLQAEIDPLARVFPLPREPNAYGPNDMMLYDIRSVTGMRNFRLQWTETLFGGPDYQNLYSPTLWPLLDVDYVITRRQVNTPLLERAGSGPHGAAWRVKEESPHAWFPRRVEPLPDSAAAVQRLLERSDPAAFALVAGDGEGELPPAGAGSAHVTSFTPNEVTLAVEAEAAGLLVVSEIFHPNWQATVDGTETELYRTDIALWGVNVPAGRHELRVSYAAGAVRWGLVLGLVALLASIGGIVVDGLAARRRRRADEAEEAAGTSGP